MQKSDIRELRKQLKKGTNEGLNIIDWIYGFYVDGENNVLWEKCNKLYTLNDEERFRQTDIVNAIINPALGKTSFSVDLHSQTTWLIDLRDTQTHQGTSSICAEAEKFRDMLLSDYTHTDPYYASISHIVYDVPFKAKDGGTLEDGQEVYDALVFAICPSKLSPATLGFEHGEVGELGRRWVIGKPVDGFVYPAFAERQTDLNKALLYTKHPQENAVLSGLFDVLRAPVDVQTQQECVGNLIQFLDVTVEQAAAICTALTEREPEETLEKREIRNIIEEAGVSTDSFDAAFADAFGDLDAVSVEAVKTAKTVVKTDSCNIAIDAEYAQTLETRMIDGRPYILIPADGDVSVNGVKARMR